MHYLFAKADLAPFLSPRKRAEKEIRAQCSENVILQVHDAIYSPVKRATAHIRDGIDAALGAAVGVGPTSSPRDHHRRGLATLRALLEGDAKERALQDALIDSGLLALNCKVVQEVAMRPSDDYRGMRMDLVLASPTDEPSEIVELKRGCHLLLARRGQPTQKMSRQLKNAINQIKKYGDRVESEIATAIDLEDRFGIRFDNLKLQLIAGRRLPDAHGYHLLSCAEADASTPSLQLQIYTWDGLLAELERIVD